MNIELIIKILKKSIESSERDYNRNLELFGEESELTSYHKGQLEAYKLLLEFIEVNNKIDGGM